MADEMILLDTSVLIDYYRKTDKANSVLMGLLNKGYRFAISVVTKYEICAGATDSQQSFWKAVFEAISILPFDEGCVDGAVTLNANLKRKRKQIDLADLFIAATALQHNLPIATLNKKHFERIDSLGIIP
jgi:tRNA(fMet)-specific endonuclease VapC